jgi:hypothetical protein
VIEETLSTFLSERRDRPLSIAVAVLALFVPSTLTLFLSHRELFAQLGTHGVVLLAIGLSLPIELGCFSLFWTLLSGVQGLEQLSRGVAVTSPTIEDAVAGKDQYEWPSLLAGGWVSTCILYAIAAVAYFKRISVGRTYLLVASGTWLVWIVLFLLVVWAQRLVKRRVQGG